MNKRMINYFILLLQLILILFSPLCLCDFNFYSIFFLFICDFNFDSIFFFNLNVTSILILFSSYISI